VSTVRFQVLWHSVAIDVLDAGEEFVEVPDCTWPMAPALETRYRLTRDSDYWEVFQGSDKLETVDSRDSAWRTLRARILARSFELAVRKGWSAFTGTVMTSGGERTCLVGPAEERLRASQIFAQSGAVVDSHDGWIARDGGVLAVPVSPTRSKRELTIRPADRLVLWKPNGAPPAGPEALMALLDCADRSCQKAGDTVRSATAMLKSRQLAGTVTGEIPGWYVA
jgi:hypothetical protein